MDTTLKDKAAQPIQTLSERWREDPAELLPIAIPIGFLSILALTTFGSAVVVHLTGHLYGGALFALLAVSTAILVMPVLAFANGVRNGAIETARKKLAQAEEDERLRQAAEYARLDEIAKTLRLPLLEWAVKNEVTEQIAGLDHVLAAAVETDHLRPLQARHQALIDRVRRSGSPSLADGA